MDLATKPSSCSSISRTPTRHGRLWTRWPRCSGIAAVTCSWPRSSSPTLPTPAGSKEFPMPHPFREFVGMIPAELPRCPPARIVIPGVVTERDYDLVCIGSPTWWLSTDVPVRSFLQSDTASRVLKGKPFRRRRMLPPVLEAQPRDGAQTRHRTWRHFRYQGGQVRSQEHHLEEARKFADGLANRLAGNAPVSKTSHEPGDGSAVGRTCSASITSGVSPAANATANRSWTPWPRDGSPPNPTCKIPAAAALTGKLPGRVLPQP